MSPTKSCGNSHGIGRKAAVRDVRMWHIYPLLGNDRETIGDRCQAAVGKQQKNGVFCALN
jgi:hypothetical protein